MKKVLLSLLVLALLVTAFAFVVSNDQLAANIDAGSQLAGSKSGSLGLPGAGAGNKGAGSGRPAQAP